MSQRSSHLFLYVLLTLFTLSVHAQQPILRHAYSFNDGLPVDDVGSADGIIHGGGKIKDGKFVASLQGQYIELPADQIKINTYSGITLEVYLTAAENNPPYTMLSYFGSASGNNGTNYLFQSVSNSGASKSAISCGNEFDPWTSESFIQGVALLDGRKHHVVTTFDNRSLRFYLDGVLVDSANVQNPNNVIAQLGSNHAYLCKSGYSTDPTWIGAIDVFNIYEGVLDEESIRESANQYLDKPGEANNLLANVKKHTLGLAVDQINELDVPVTGKATFFAELIPTESNSNDLVDQLLVFTNGDISNSWDDFSACIRLSAFSGYVDVYDKNGHLFDIWNKVAVEVGSVYQCWVTLDVATNRYSVYVKNDGMEEPIPIWVGARFREEASEITHWAAIHNWHFDDDALVVNSLAKVNQVGEYPAGYLASGSQKSQVTKEQKHPLAGHWFNTNTGDWEFALLDEVAIYDAEVWNYSMSVEADEIIELTNGDRKVALHYKLKNTKLFLGESAENLQELDHTSRYNNVPNPTDPDPFAGNIVGFDTAVFAGYIQGYSSSIGRNVGQLHVNDFIDSEYIISIDTLGFFESKIPLLHPTNPNFSCGFITSSPYLTPGKKTFIFVGNTPHTKYLVMGENARLSMEIHSNIFRVTRTSSDQREQMHEMGIDKWRESCKSMRRKDSVKLEELWTAGRISKRFYQIHKLNLDYSHYRDILDIQIQTPRRNLQTQSQSVDPESLDFLHERLVNNPLGPLASNYSNFMNRVEYLHLNIDTTPQFHQYFKQALENGFPFEDYEVNLIEDWVRVSSKDAVKHIREFFSKYGDQSRKFHEKHKNLLSEFQSHNPDVQYSISEYAEFLISQGIILTKEEEEMIRASEELEQNKMVKEHRDFYASYGKKIGKLLNGTAGMWCRRMQNIDELREHFGIQKGLASDVMLARDIHRALEPNPGFNRTPERYRTNINREELEWVLEYIGMEEVVEFLRWYYDQAQNFAISTDKIKPLEVPQVSSDRVFDTIVGKYRGKVVYVDFWATWCGPCLSGMQHLEGLKKKLKREDIVFLNIASPSSNPRIYDKLIQKYSGEHYLVSGADWQAMGEKFNINAIPRYFLINKKGEIVDANATNDPVGLSLQLEELLAE